MSGSEIKTNGRRTGENEVPDEELKLPGFVVNANWMGDVPEMAKEINEEIGFEPYEREADYKSRMEVDPETERAIDLFNKGKVGSRVARLVSKAELEEMLYGKAA